MLFPRLNKLRDSFPWLNLVKESVFKLVKPLGVTSLLVIGSILGVRYLGWLESAELAAYDQLIRHQPKVREDDRLLVVGITEKDVQALQEWPVSDRTMARILTNIEQHQPHTIAIDVFRDFPHEPGTEELLTKLQQNPNTLIVCKASSADHPGIPPPLGILPEQVGFADFVVDPGGILRRSLLMTGPPEPAIPFPKQHLCNQPDQTLLSISFRATLQYLESQGVEAAFTADQQLRFGSTLIPQIHPHTGGYQGADTKGYQIMLHYRSEKRAVPTVSLMEVLENKIDPQLIRDRIVFVGYTTPQAKDDFYTPYSVSKDDNQKMPGVIIHAQAASQLISTVLDAQPLIWVWSTPVEVLWILAWSLLGGISGWYLRHPVAFATVILAGCGSLYCLCLVIFFQSGWVPLVPPLLTFIGTAVGVVLLDRFNNSSYGQQVYRKVKNLLNLEIEIDEEKIKEQVSEITETEYFRGLQDTVKRLRNQPPQSRDTRQSKREGFDGLSPHNLDVSSPPETDIVSKTNAKTSSQPGRDWTSKSTVVPDKSVAGSAPKDHRQTELPPESLDSLDSINTSDFEAAQLFDSFDTSDFEAAATEDELAFIQQLNQEVQQLKQDMQPKQVMKAAENHTSFALDLTFCDYTDTSEITQDYIAHLVSKLAALKADIAAQQLS